MSGIDKNLFKNLAELEKHPALLDRCRKLYISKRSSALTFDQLADELGIHVQTAYRYFHAYKKIAKQYNDVPDKDELMQAIHETIVFYKKKQEGALITRDFCHLGRLILSNQSLLCELQGFLERQPVMNVNFVNNIVQNIVNILPEVLKQQGLPEETIQNILTTTAERLEKAQQPA